MSPGPTTAAGRWVGFWSEVVRVRRRDARVRPAPEAELRALGNQLPHLHVHLTARFASDDVAPGAALPAARDTLLPEQTVNDDAAALGALLAE
jgi:diadenosine tetraphosphate (Ap4A) HIT family hydrolase